MALLSAVSANQPLTTEYPTDCKDGADACSGSICCTFKYTIPSSQDTKVFERCVDSTQRGGSYSGSYIDDGEAEWKYTCPKPPPADASSKGANASGLATSLFLIFASLYNGGF